MRRVLGPVLDVVFCEALNALSFQPLMNTFQVMNRDVVNREPAHQRPPFGAHVRYREARVYGKTGHARTREFHSGVQHFIVVVEPAKRDDDVFACRAVGKLAFENHLDAARNLPPELACCPHGCPIGTHDRSADRAQGSVHVGVRIGRHDERTRNHIAALHHDLVSYTRTSGIKVDAVLLGERFDRAVLLLVGFLLVLNIVVESEDELLGIVNLLRADPLELAHDCRRVVMGHYMKRPDGNEVPRAERAIGTFCKVSLRDFFNNGLGHKNRPPYHYKILYPQRLKPLDFSPPAARLKSCPSRFAEQAATVHLPQN